MTRVLPWLVDSTTTKGEQLDRPSPTKRLKAEHGPSADYASIGKSGPRPHSSVIKDEASRAASSSPPPSQPPQQSPLRPGLNRDDIYIMVEDEFLATAQSFTRHLHHAEYQRLKRLVRDRNDGDIANVSRATDGTTAMREELRRKKQAEEAGARTKKGVEDALRPHKRSAISASDSETDVVVAKDNEPWQGTHLQSFMTASPQNSKRSLTGLQGVSSKTRAAAGFAKAQKQSPSKSQQKTIFPIEKVVEEQANDEGSDTDDLDAPAKAIVGKSHKPVRADKIMSSSYDDRMGNHHAQVRARLKARQDEEAEERSKQAAAQSAGRDEIPVFLV